MRHTVKWNGFIRFIRLKIKVGPVAQWLEQSTHNAKMACFRRFKIVSKSFILPLILLNKNAFIAFFIMMSDLVEPEVKVAQKVAQPSIRGFDDEFMPCVLYASRNH